jgi:hypothetical protein
LTKETVSINNGGGGNYGAVDGADINQIKTTPSSSPAPPGETKTSTPIEPDEPCFACSKTLPKDHFQIMRFMCCGRGMHHKCLEKRFKGLTEAYRKANAPKCPCCNTLYPTEGTDEEWAVLKKWTKTHKELSWPYCIMAFRIKAGYFKDASFHSQSLIKDNYEKAALLSNAVGMLNLGAMYGNGRHGTKRCYATAVGWWTKAAALGDVLSIRSLKMFDHSKKLVAACSKGDLKAVNVLLAGYANANFQRESGGWTPLLAACGRGFVNIVKVLFARELIQINQGNNNGATPLFMACQEDHVKIVNALLARKEIQINQARNDGCTPLNVACQKGHVKVVNLLLARKEIQINQPENSGATPLIVASYLGNSSVVEVLLLHAEIVTTGTFDNSTTAYDCSKASMRIAKSWLDDKINEKGRIKCQSLLKLFDEKKK